MVAWLNPLMLAQASPWGHTLDILLAIGGLALLVLLGTGLILFLRSRMGADDQSDDDRSPFSLADLRRMHRDGHLTDEEYESARGRILAMFDPEASSPAGDHPQGESAPPDDSSHAVEADPEPPPSGQSDPRHSSPGGFGG